MLLQVKDLMTLAGLGFRLGVIESRISAVIL